MGHALSGRSARRSGPMGLLAASCLDGPPPGERTLGQADARALLNRRRDDRGRAPRGPLRTLHTFSFVAWGVLIGVHVLAYLTRVLHDGTMDWRRNAVDVVAGVRSRRAILVGALLAGVVLASSTLPAQRTVLHHGGHRHHHEARSR